MFILLEKIVYQSPHISKMVDKKKASGFPCKGGKIPAQPLFLKGVTKKLFFENIGLDVIQSGHL